MKSLTIILCLLVTISLNGQDFHSKIISTYNFSPQKLKEEEKKAIYIKLDEFFDYVKQNKGIYLDSLRNELKSDSNSPYFYFDAGYLLSLISQEPEDIQLVADALMKVDLKDLSPDMYVSYLQKLSVDGANVIEPAFRILDDSSFVAFFPNHSLTLTYGEALKFILPRYSPDLYLKKLIEKFELMKSVDNQISCLDLFIFANCCEADKFLSQLKNDKNQSQKLKDKIVETLNMTTVSANANETSYNEYFEKRKMTLKRVSDEAVYELQELTLLMRMAYECK